MLLLGCAAVMGTGSASLFVCTDKQDTMVGACCVFNLGLSLWERCQGQRLFLQHRLWVSGRVPGPEAVVEVGVVKQHFGMETGVQLVGVVACVSQPGQESWQERTLWEWEALGHDFLSRTLEAR